MCQKKCIQGELMRITSCVLFFVFFQRDVLATILRTPGPRVLILTRPQACFILMFQAPYSTQWCWSFHSVISSIEFFQPP